MSTEDCVSSSQTWLGTSLAEIYRGQGPWNFETPSVSPSRVHSVLYKIPLPLQGPPEPHYTSSPNHWDDDHVRMPYSPSSLFVIEEDGKEVIKPRWDVISTSLLKPIQNSEELEQAIHSYNTKLPKFSALHRFFNETLEEDETEYFFDKILPEIIRLALRLPEFIPGSIPILKKDQNRSISLSQLQISSLMANAFLCTFIWSAPSNLCPGANFVRLFATNGRRDSCITEKLKCICHYFRKVTTKPPLGCMTFERRFIHRRGMPRWDAINNNIGNTKIHITSVGTIEDGAGMLQADFANKNIGGGVLGYGCVQEEIRFVICPELIISRLFIEQLGDNEAVHIMGAERYSNYSGYGDSFTWAGDNDDCTPLDDYRRKRTSIVVIDATHFNRPKDQFHCSPILRELNKAYVGFNSKEKSNAAPIATGNWGCGAFKGDPNLKSLIQLMACSAANRDLVYYSFGNVDLQNEFYNMHLFLANNKITICQMWRYLCRFCAANLPQDRLYSYIQQAHFDTKSQPTLKQFFNFTDKKSKKHEIVASTSSEPKSPNKREHRKEERKSNSPTLLIKDNKKMFNVLGPQTKHKAIEQNRNVVSSDDIISAISQMYGDDEESAIPSDHSVNNSTLLSEIDKLVKTEISTRSNEPLNDKSDFVMDIDNDEEEMCSGNEEKKRKITDYFTKLSKPD